MIYKTTYSSPLGEITIASNGSELIGLWFTQQKYYMKNIDEETEEKADLKIFDDTKNWLDRYFLKQKPNIFEISLAPIGNEFRQSVWQILCKIPYGQINTYGEIAKKYAHIKNKSSMSAQAIGSAIGHNPISIIIPCHRVIGKNKQLLGYAGGIDKKIQLLEHEGFYDFVR